MSGIFNNAEKYRNTSSVSGIDERGERGPPGIGFALTSDGNYDMDQKMLRNVKVPDDVSEDSDLDTYIKDMDTGINKRYVNENFLKKGADENYDLNQGIIKNSEPYYDGLYDDHSLVSNEYVDLQDAKQDIAINNNSQLIGNSLLHLDGSKQMTGDLDLGDNKVTNAKDPTDDSDLITKRWAVDNLHAANYHNKIFDHYFNLLNPDLFVIDSKNSRIVINEMTIFRKITDWDPTNGFGGVSPIGAGEFAKIDIYHRKEHLATISRFTPSSSMTQAKNSKSSCTLIWLSVVYTLKWMQMNFWLI